ncbi:MAG: hypothetical protein Q4C61_05200 [Lachnospiraceae bacterium]|nr:hypothetical protein [Lachnospiraceae bacterium]
MSSKPKIVVLKLREIIYTLMLLFLVVLLVICLVLMFSGKAKKSGTSGSPATENPAAQNTEDTFQTPLETAVYKAGVYTTPITLGDSAVDVEVTVDSNHINAIRLVNLSETTAAAYPLVSPSLEHIASQILEKQSLEDITCPQENRYTSQMLLSAVAKALELAQNTD